MRPLRIAMVHRGFSVQGGAERYLRDLARSLVHAGHEVRVFAPASANAEPGDVELGPRLTARIPLPHRAARKASVHIGDVLDVTARRGANELRRFAPDAVHVHNWQELGAPLVARLSRLWPTFHTVHDYALCDTN